MKTTLLSLSLVGALLTVSLAAQAEANFAATGHWFI